MALPSHPCGYPVQGDGHPCKHRVADPQQRFCAEHEQEVQAAALSNQALIDMVPADRRLTYGDHVWDRTFPSAWCLRHQAMATLLGGIGGQPPCVAELDASDFEQAAWQSGVVLHLPPDQLDWVDASSAPAARIRAVRGHPFPDRFKAWVPTDEVDEVRRAGAARMQPKHLDWALRDSDPVVRAIAAQRAPLQLLDCLQDEQDDRVLLALTERPDIGQVAWARHSTHPLVRLAYLRGRPDVGSESWAKTDSYAPIRVQYAQHCSIEDLCEWGPTDPDPDVRQVAVRRMPMDKLGWAAKDESPAVRRTLLVRAPAQYAPQLADDPDPFVATLASTSGTAAPPDPRQDEDLSWFIGPPRPRGRGF